MFILSKRIKHLFRFEIEDLFGQTENANNILQKNLPLEMKDGMNNQVIRGAAVKERERMVGHSGIFFCP